MKNLLFLLLLFPCLINAQIVFQKIYGGVDGEGGNSVRQTTDGGYIVAGWSNSFGCCGYRFYLIKIDSVGDTVWTQTYGGVAWDEGYSVQQTTDGGYIVAGGTATFGAGFEDIYLIKTDALGNAVWTQTYGGVEYDEGYSVQQTADGGYIIAGTTRSFGPVQADVYLIKTNASGTVSWTQTYGGVAGDLGRSVRQTTDGGYIITGSTESFGAGGYDLYLIKTNSVGVTVWAQTYGGVADEWGNSVQQTTDGGYIIVGCTECWLWGLEDVYLVKTDSLGVMVWTQTYGGIGEDAGESVQQTTDGGYVIVGITTSFGAGGADVYLIKTDALGNAVWTQTYGGLGGDYGRSVQQTTDGGYIVSGRTTSFGSGWSDVYLIKTDGNGNAGPVGLLPDKDLLLLSGGGAYPRDAKVFYYDLMGRTVLYPHRLAPGQLYITAVYSSAGRLLGHKLKLAP